MDRVNQSWILALAMLLPAGVCGQTGSTPVKEHIRMGGQTVAVLEWPQQYFPDVPGSSPYFASVGFLASRQVARGDGAGLFNPNTPLSRAEMAAFIVRSVRSAQGLIPDPQLGEYSTVPVFRDVPNAPWDTSKWAFPFVQVLYQMGLTTGCAVYEDGTKDFCPVDSLTVEQMATFTVRAVQFLTTGNGQTAFPYSSSPVCFTDPGMSTSWAFPYVQKISEMGVLDQACGQGPLGLGTSILRGPSAWYISRGILGEKTF